MWILFYGIVADSEDQLFQSLVDACWRNQVVREYKVMKMCRTTQSDDRCPGKQDDANNLHDAPVSSSSNTGNEEVMSESGSTDDEDNPPSSPAVKCIRQGVTNSNTLEEIRDEFQSQSDDVQVVDEEVDNRQAVESYLGCLSRAKALNVLEQIGGGSLVLDSVPEKNETCCEDEHRKNARQRWFVYAAGSLVSWNSDLGKRFRSPPIDMYKLCHLSHRQLQVVANLLNLQQPCFHIWNIGTS